MNVLIINGPNLNLLGKREPSIYGTASFDEVLESLRNLHKDIHVDFFQSNIEGALIDRLQKADGVVDGVVLNAGGYTHTSVALGDAVSAIGTKVIEVHISNVFSREAIRQTSFIAPHCAGSITGFGVAGYHLALLALKDKSMNLFLPKR